MKINKIQKVYFRIHHLSRKLNIIELYGERKFVKELYCRAVKELYCKYLVAPVIMETSNVAFICQQFYAFSLAKELEILNDNKNTGLTYKQISSSNFNIINKNSNFWKTIFIFNLNGYNKQLSPMCWLPKL